MRGVQTCVCFAAPAEMLGEVVGVAVVPVPGGPPPTLPELQAALTLALALALSLSLALALSLSLSIPLSQSQSLSLTLTLALALALALTLTLALPLARRHPALLSPLRHCPTAGAACRPEAYPQPQP